MKKSLLLGTLFGCFLNTSAANAALTELDLITPDDGLLTYDSVINLDWLDVNATAGISYSSIVSDYGGYTTDYGLRYASIYEIKKLFEGVGFGPFAAITDSEGNTQSSTTNSSAYSLAYLLGPTIPAPADTSDVAFVRGTTEYVQAGNPFSRQFSTLSILLTGTLALADLDGGSNGSQGQSIYYGNWLVRESSYVPAPATLALLSLGLAGIGYRRRSERRA